MSLKINDEGILFWRNEEGRYHRDEGPAVIWPVGTLEYVIDGMYHRLGGPAIIGPSGQKYYYIAGKEYSREELLN